MKFILTPLLSVALCQFIKFIIYFWQGGRLSRNTLLWEGFWVAKFPSSHGAFVASSLYLLWMNGGLNAVFGFAFVVSLILIYSILEDKKRQELVETYMIKSKDDELKKLVTDRKLYDFNGHTLFEMLSGIVVGLIVSIVLN